jgi:hypothetical protein
VVAAFRLSDEAEAAQKALQKEGIVSEAGPRTTGIERMCVDAFDSGFDVVVDKAEGERAIALLRHLWPDAAEPIVELRCPSCRASDVTRLPRLRIFLLAAMLMVVGSIVFGERDLFLLLTAIIAGLLLLTPRWRCRACGERWR